MPWGWGVSSRTGQLWQAAEKAARDAQLRQLYDDNLARPEYFA